MREGKGWRGGVEVRDITGRVMEIMLEVQLKGVVSEVCRVQLRRVPKLRGVLRKHVSEE